MDVWAGDIELPGGAAVQGVELVSAQAPEPTLDRVSLRFLAVVDVARIPLCVAIAPPLDVFSHSDSTQDWFSTLLLGGHAAAKDGDLPWWQASAAQSPIGILVQVVRGAASNGSGPRITELLFYAASSAAAPDEATGPPSPTSSSPSSLNTPLAIRALPLSSDLLQILSAVTTPPLSPSRTTAPPAPANDDANTITTAAAAAAAEFLPLPPPLSAAPSDAITNDRKRQSVSSLFDEAAARRKRARRKGGESIAAAAAGGGAGGGGGPAPLPALQHHKRSASSSSAAAVLGLQHQHQQQQESVGRVGSYAEGAKGGGDGQARRMSTLSRVTTSVAGGDESVEARNKDVVSRLVMAGMRMYGLQQQRKRTVGVRKGSVASEGGAAAQQGEGAGADGGDESAAARDEEYKLVYHQAYRGTVFAMRNHITTEPLTLHMEQLRETVDKLLAIFCTDPLPAPAEQQSSSAVATLAPKKQPFGASTGEFGSSPFGQRYDPFGGAKVAARTERVHTPVIRRQAG